jgi:hypothetical protein
MNKGPRVVSKADARVLLHRAGVNPERIVEILAHLPDPFDVDHEQPVLDRYGVTQGQLMESLGGSP